MQRIRRRGAIWLDKIKYWADADNVIVYIYARYLLKSPAGLIYISARGERRERDRESEKRQN